MANVIVFCFSLANGKSAVGVLESGDPGMTRDGLRETPFKNKEWRRKDYVKKKLLYIFFYVAVIKKNKK